MKDRPGHTNDRVAIFFGEVASGTGSAAEGSLTVPSGVRHIEVIRMQWFMGVRVRGAGGRLGVA